LLPSYTSYRLWDLAHNRTHHAFTRFKALDYMWRPMSPAKFRVVSPWRRALERVYRTGLGHGLYYFVEIYCRKLIVPSPRFVPERRAAYWGDTLAVAGFAVLQLGLYVTAAVATRQSPLWVLFTAMVLPFALWNVLAGSASFVRDTRPEIAWFDDIDEWRAAKPQLPESVHVSPAAFFDAVRRCKLYDYKRTAGSISRGASLRKSVPAADERI
jgi:omega-6 fatty acid desaturase (delta-12 desaturase)